MSIPDKIVNKALAYFHLTKGTYIQQMRAALKAVLPDLTAAAVAAEREACAEIAAQWAYGYLAADVIRARSKP